MRIRAVDSLEDIAALNAVFARVWDARARSQLPNGMLRAATAHANPAFAAFDPDVIGGALGWWGRDPDGTVFLFSQKLCVIDSQRRRGVARALKRAQAEFAQEHGVSEIRWTFDPMLAANAAFNLRTLGAIGIAFFEDLYGPREDALNAGERTDRLLVSWTTGFIGRARGEQSRRCTIPSDYRSLPAEQREPQRDRVRDELLQAFADGYRATGFEDFTYILERSE